jgi:hypothetical protein
MCPDCETKKRQKYEQQLNAAKEAARAYGKAQGLAEMVIVASANGIPTYREPGDESLARLRTIDHVFIT